MANNEYLDLIQQDIASQQIPPASGDGETDYRALINEDLKSGPAAAMYAASQKSSQQAASATELRISLGLPEGMQGMVERNYDRLSKLHKQRSIDYDRLAKDAPATTQWLSDPVNASVAQDDIDNLTGIEQAWDYLKKGGSALASGLPKFNEGIYGLGQAVTDTARTYVTGPLSKPINTGLFDLQVLPEDPLAPVSDFFSDLRQGQKGLAESMMPKGDGSVEQGVYSGLQSLGQNLLTLPAAIMSGNPGVALAPMVGGVGGSEYGRARDKGLDYSTAAIYATSQAAVEFATEKLPMGMLIKDLEKNTGFMSMLGKQLAAELPGEQIATLLQDLNEWAALNPEKPFSSYLAERPNAALQTAIATAIGTGGMVTVAKGIDTAASRFDARAAKAAKAIETRQAFERMNSLVNQTKFKTVSPSTMKAFADHVAEGGSVYIDARELANALQQSGISMNQVAVDIPSIAEQLQTKAAAGQHIKIPASEFLTKIAGTDYAPVMLDHLKTDPNDLSNAEADEILKGNSEAAKAEVERIIRVKRDVDAHEASAEVVRKGFEDQLNAADRFSKDVNKAKAQMLGSFYSVMAARIGITPEEMAARYPLQIRAENVGGQQVLNQDSDEIFYHDSDEPFSGIIEGKGRFGSAIFARQGRPSGYGKHTKAMRIKGEILELGGLREELGTDSGRDALKNILGRNTTDDAVDSVIEALTDGSHYPTDPDVWDAIGATDETDATVEIQTLRGNIARSLGYAAVRTPDEFDGETIMVLDNGAIADVNALNQAAQLPETIEIDGVQRPTANSNGKPIAQTEEGIRNFWRWFSPSPRHLLDGLSVSEVSSLKRDTEALADFIESQTGLSESDRFTIIPPSVFAHVAGAVNNDKVLDAVVRSLPVDVVDFFGGEQGAAKKILNDAAMLEKVFSVNPTPDVAFGVNPARIAELTVRLVANAGAKISGVTSGALERNSAVLADANDPILGAHVRKSPNADLGIIAGFGDSKVVDEQGRPLVVYHGTGKDFTEFDLSKSGESTGNTGFYGAGAYFSQDSEDASSYALWARRTEDDAANVMPTYLSLQKPLYLHINPKDEVSRQNARDSVGRLVDQLAGEGYFGQSPNKDEAGSLYSRLSAFVEKGDFERAMGTLYNELKGGVAVSELAKRAGFDGVMVEGFKRDANFLAEAVAFSPEQIKSATGNRGTFDPQNPNILYQSGNREATGDFVSNAAPTLVRVDRASPELAAFSSEFSGSNVTINAPRIEFVANQIRRKIVEGEEMANDMRKLFADWQAYKEKHGIASDNIADIPADVLGDALDRGAMPTTAQDVATAEKQGAAQVEKYTRLLKEVEGYASRVSDSGVFETGKPVTVRVFHGSDSARIAEEGFSKEKLGSNTGAGSAKMGFFFAGSPATSNSYTTDVHTPLWDILSRDDRYEILSYLGDDASAAHDAIDNLRSDDDQVRDMYREAIGKEAPEINPTVYPNRIHMKNPYVYDYKGERYREESYAKVITDAKKAGHDGAILLNTYDGGPLDNIFVVFDENQIEQTLYQNQQDPRAEIAFGNDISQTPTVISLLKGADLSSFIHESGHFFLEVLADISSRPNAPLLLQEDFKTVMDWFGVTREQWAGMTLEQKRPYHEQFARGFEVYAWEGKAPNMALQKLFQRFRAWMLDAYKKLLDAFKNRDLGQALDVRLSDDVRAVFDRMLSTQEQINEAKAVRGYLPAFETKEEAEAAGVDWEQYQADIAQADEDAITDLESRSLRDLRWFRNAHNKEVRRLRREAAALRREARIDARAEVLRHPIYQVMQFLTARVDAIKAPKAKSDPNVVDPANDSLLVAVAKLGGLQRDMAVDQFGLDPADFKKTPVFGKPILRRNGGLTPDGMAEALAQLGYMPAKWGGSWDMNDLGDYLHDEGRGIPHYSENFDYRNLEEQNAGLPDLEANPFVGGRIDRESMVREYGGSTEEFPWENLGKMISNDGIHPDVIADRFGFQSGDEMVRFLLEAKPLLSAIEDTTDRIMFERHGDLTSKEALDKAADEAIHNRMRAKVLATEANALAKTLGARGITAKAARVFAERILAGMKILDIKPSHFAAEESKAAGRFDKARKKGNVNDQALEKRNQLVNNIATRLAYDVESEVVKAIRHFKQLQKPGSQKSMRGEYLEQLNALLERFELRTGGNSRKSINKANTLPAFAEWLQSKAEELGAPTPDMVAFVLDGGVKKPYRDMTLEEFRGLVDAVKQLEHLARREQKQYMAIRGMEFEQEKNAILDRLRQFHPDAFDADGNPKGQAPDFVPSLKQKLGKDANALLGEFLGNETIVNILEGGEMGLLHESLFKRISDRSNWRTTRMEGIFKKLEPLFDQYSIAEKRAFSTKDIGGPIGIPITREKALGVALLVGNAEGRDRVRNYGWTDEQIIKIIDLLDERDKRLAEAVWDLFDNDLWPDLKALNERTAGKAPPKVESTPYTNRLGTWKGGYMRLKYDSDLDERAYKFDVEQSLTDLRNGMGMSSKTPQGTSIERKQGVLMRPRLDFNVFVETVTETVHDIAYREAVSDVIRLLNDKEIQAAIKQAGGVEVFRAMRRRVAEVAARPRDPFGFIEKFVSIARRNTIVTLMSGVGTAFQNLTGLIPAAGRVHPWLLAREVQRFYSTDMKKSYDFAVSQSEYMRHRFTSYEQDLVNMANKLTVKGSLMPDTATFLALMGWIDRGVSVPVWNAAFAEGMEKHANDRVLAVEYADHVVRQTQGSGRIVDKPGIMSGHPLKTIFTMFHSYFNGQLQQLVRAGLVSAQEAKTNPRAAAGRVALAFVVFWILPALVTEMFRRTPDDEDDEEKAMRYAKGLLLYPAAMFPLVRDIAPWAWDKYVADSGWARSFRMSPVESAVEGVAKGVESTVDIVKGEGDQRDVKSLLMGVGFTFGVPGKLISDVVTGIYDFATGEAGPEAMLVGPQPKK